MHAHELRAQLELLHWERLEAESTGLAACEAYMRDLEQEVSECSAALVGASVAEIAVARGELWGRQQG